MRRSFLILLIAALHLSCSAIRIQKALMLTGGGWQSYGGGAERSNHSAALPSTALREVWTADIPAGVGQYGVLALDSLVVLCDLHGEVHLFRLADGHEVGSKSFGASIAAAPVLDRDTMYLGLSRSDPNLLAYSLASGKMIWRLKIGDIEVPLLRVGEKIVALCYEGMVVAVDKGSGAIAWKYKVPPRSRTTTLRSAPASDGNAVVFGCDDGSVFCLNLSDGSLRWRAHTRQSVLAGPSIAGGRVYCGSMDSTFYAFDLQSGTVLWQRPLGADIVNSQAIVRGAIVVATSGQRLFSLQASDGALRWNHPLAEMPASAPLAGDSIVVLGCLNKDTYAFRLADGQEVWTEHLDGRVRSVPAASAGMLFLVTDDRHLHAYGTKETQP